MPGVMYLWQKGVQVNLGQIPGCPELCGAAGNNASLSCLLATFMRGCSHNFDNAYSCITCKGQKNMCGASVQIIFLSY